LDLSECPLQPREDGSAVAGEELALVGAARVVDHAVGGGVDFYWGQSFRIDFLICQLEDINPKGLTLIKYQSERTDPNKRSKPRST
jgi:hypothetical protein